jgi:tetratricopeptide (TPR) repeat protein
MHALQLAIMMISCGILGGLINSYLDKSSKEIVNTTWEYIVIGIGAALLVPLFLNMIGSTLIEGSFESLNSTLVIMGFCLVASMTSRTFIKSISDKALQKAQSAETKANEVAATLNITEKRQNSIIMPVVMIELEKYQQAVTDLDKTLKTDPEFSEAWAWRGFAQKRLGNFEEAVQSMEKAIRLEKSPDILWHYNLACYKSLAGRSMDNIAVELDLIYKSKDPRRDDLIASLTTDADFDPIRHQPAFQRYLS